MLVTANFILAPFFPFVNTLRQRICIFFGVFTAAKKIHEYYTFMLTNTDKCGIMLFAAVGQGFRQEKTKGETIFMTKADLISAVAEKTELTKKDCGKALDALTEVITETLVKGDKVQLVGFGTFETREHAARTGINPRTKEKIEITATRVPAFKAGQGLKDAVAK